MGYDAQLWALDKAPTWMTLKTPVRTFKNYRLLTQALKKEEAIKVATWWETASPVWESSIVKGIPAFIIHEIESAFYPDNPTAQVAVVSSYRKEFNNIISCGYTLDGIRSLGLSGELIPCGYDNTNYRKIPIEKKNDQLLAIGRSFFQKNLKQTLSAWKLSSKSPKLVLFGSEPQVVQGNNNIDYHVRPTDQEVNKLYNESAVFVQTSYHEGFCLPVLEAMAVGCPVVCTDANGNRDFSFNEKNCLMVEKDDPKGTAQAIDKLLSDNKLRNKLIAGGLKTAEKYTWPVVMTQIDKFYRKISSDEKSKYIVKAMKKYK
jgi:glycosyltransferase involved in cell wall biosynthesis